MDKVWTADDARLLRELRTASGMDRAAFARRCAISAGQLTELEQGGSGHFYSEAIKAHTGRMLLARLGYIAPKRPPVPVPAPDDRSAAPSAPVAPPPVEALPVASAPVEPDLSLPTPEARTAASATGSGRTWAGTLVVACAVIGLLAWLNRPKAPAAPATAMAAVETVQMAPALPPAEARESAGPAATAPASAAANEARCPEASGALVKFTPLQPLKAGNYIYLEASRPVQVCVSDARQQVTTVQVKPVAGETVPGTPPFTVQSTGWADLRVFFQGVRVPLEGLGTLDALELQTP